jgi:hypothetical protein
MKKYISLVLMMMMVVVGLGACGKACGKKIGGGPEASSLKLIPSGQNLLLGLDWHKLQQSPLGAKFQQKIPPEAVPLLKEVQTFTLGMKLPGMGQEPKELVGIISGELDQAKLLAAFTETAQKEGQEVTTEEYDGVKIYSTSNEPTMGIAFVGEHGVMGDKVNLKKVIDLSKNKGDSVEKDKALMDLMQGVDTGKMLWAVAVVPEGMMPGGPQAEAGPMGAFSQIKALDLALDLSKDLTLDLGVIAGTPEAAQQMQTMANSYKALFGSSLAAKNPNLGKVLNDLTIGVSGPRVALNLKVDQATVEQLSNQAESAVPPAAPEAVPGGDAPVAPAPIPPS